MSVKKELTAQSTSAATDAEQSTQQSHKSIITDFDEFCNNSDENVSVK